MADPITYSADNGIGLLQLNRPQARNALNQAMFTGIDNLLESLAGDDTLHLLVIAGNGPSFCAGTDINALVGATSEAALALGRLENQVFNRIEDFAKPTLAAIHGYALGGGCELALACDMRLAADNAIFGQPEINLGWLPAAGATFRLPALIGRAQAFELIATGRRIDAAAALSLGLVQQIVPAANLMDQAMALGRQLAKRDPALLAELKNALKPASRPEAVEREAAILARWAPGEKAQAAITKFLGRKKEK